MLIDTIIPNYSGSQLPSLLIPISSLNGMLEAMMYWRMVLLTKRPLTPGWLHLKERYLLLKALTRTTGKRGVLLPWSASVTQLGPYLIEFKGRKAEKINEAVGIPQDSRHLLAVRTILPSSPRTGHSLF
jgi:hypothetical protein